MSSDNAFDHIRKMAKDVRIKTVVTMEQWCHRCNRDPTPRRPHRNPSKKGPKLGFEYSMTKVRFAADHLYAKGWRIDLEDDGGRLLCPECAPPGTRFEAENEQETDNPG